MNEASAYDAIQRGAAHMVEARWRYVDDLCRRAVDLQDPDYLDRLHTIDTGPIFERDGTGNYVGLLDPGVAVASGLPL